MVGWFGWVWRKGCDAESFGIENSHHKFRTFGARYLNLPPPPKKKTNVDTQNDGLEKGDSF